MSPGNYHLDHISRLHEPNQKRILARTFNARCLSSHESPIHYIHPFHCTKPTHGYQAASSAYTSPLSPPHTGGEYPTLTHPIGRSPGSNSRLWTLSPSSAPLHKAGKERSQRLVGFLRAFCCTAARRGGFGRLVALAVLGGGG